MKINISGTTFTDCETGIRIARPDVELNIDQSWFTRCQTAIKAGALPDLAVSLGLPPNVSRESLIEVLRILQAHEKAQPEAKRALIDKSSLGDAIRTSGSGASVVSALLNLQSSGLLAGALAALGG